MVFLGEVIKPPEYRKIVDLDWNAKKPMPGKWLAWRRSRSPGSSGRLAGRPYRTTMDCRWGFHQVDFSERVSRVITFVTPFGSFCYNRLVMGYISASAEF